jgi:hypothetical protein
MAKQLLVQFVDDLDDKEIPEGTGENIKFSVNGAEYEIDLNDKNAKEFHRKLDYYIGYSTKIGGRQGRKTSAGGGSATTAPKRDAAQTRAIREWAIAQGYELSARGRIPAAVEQAFDAAH